MNEMTINGEQLRNTLEAFAEFGATENMGVTRLSLSEEDRDARNYFKKSCESLGMKVVVDDMGVMYATLAGKQNKPPILMGSHADSVKKGGRFDGILGVVAGLEVVRTFVENNIVPEIPLTVVNFTNEEGARFEPSMMASGVLANKFDKTAMYASTDVDGITFEEALIGIDYQGSIDNRIKEATGFVELHIEQGPILERVEQTIGVVECVLGMVCYDIEVYGESNHAGTTPMSMRNDALFAANNLITEAREKLSKLDSNLVFTMGRINAYPNIHTVIPNKVIFSLEARHQDEQVIKEVEAIIESLKQSVGKEDCDVKTTKLWGRDTVWFDENICKKIEESANELNYSNRRMVSGAGHDAQFMQSMTPTAMIFVPSINGKSHDEDELTTWEDCEKGVNIVLRTVVKMLNEQ